MNYTGLTCPTETFPTTPQPSFQPQQFLSWKLSTDEPSGSIKCHSTFFLSSKRNKLHIFQQTFAALVIKKDKYYHLDVSIRLIIGNFTEKSFISTIFSPMFTPENVSIYPTYFGESPPQSLYILIWSLIGQLSNLSGYHTVSDLLSMALKISSKPQKSCSTVSAAYSTKIKHLCRIGSLYFFVSATNLVGKISRFSLATHSILYLTWRNAFTVGCILSHSIVTLLIVSHILPCYIYSEECVVQYKTTGLCDARVQKFQQIDSLPIINIVIDTLKTDIVKPLDGPFPRWRQNLRWPLCLHVNLQKFFFIDLNVKRNCFDNSA